MFLVGDSLGERREMHFIIIVMPPICKRVFLFRKYTALAAMQHKAQ